MIAAPPPPPARVQVVAQEFRYTLSRQRVRAGRVVIELQNLGEDAHDLELLRANGAPVLRWPEAAPGAVLDREVRLRPGTYLLVCTVANHRALGMQATLRVMR